MRHKYLTAERHPRRRLPRVAPDTFPAGAGFDEFLFLIIRHRRKLTSSPVRASFDAGPRFATRIRLEFGRTRAAQVDPRPRIHYIRTFYIRREREKEKEKGKKERKRGERRGSSLQNSSNRGPFSSESSLSFNERPNREPLYPSLTAETIYRGNTVSWYEPAMLNSNYNFNYSRFEIDANGDNNNLLEREEDDESRVFFFFSFSLGKKRVANS